MIGLVVVSHSHLLATSAVELAREMLGEHPVRIRTAAGLDETTLGTDAVRIQRAIEQADSGDGVVVLMDLGSAVLSAELALELLDDGARSRVVLCPAPLVEGLVVASVTAASGADRFEVAADATGALAAKIAQLAPAPAEPAVEGAPVVEASPATGAVGPDAAELTEVFTVTNRHGLHARPAARLVRELGALDVRARLRNLDTGSDRVPASSLSRVAALGVRTGHRVELAVTGPDAAEAVRRVVALAETQFGEVTGQPASAEGSVQRPGQVRGPSGASPGIAVGPVRRPGRAPLEIQDGPVGDPGEERQRLDRAIATVRGDIERVRARTARELGEQQAAIFDAHLLLLADTDLLDRAGAGIDAGAGGARAWATAVREVSGRLAELADPYLRARAADVDAVGDQVLRALLETAPGHRGGGSTALGRAPLGAGVPDGGVLDGGMLDGGEVGALGRGGADVLVAAELGPAEVAELDPASVAAVVLAFGSPASHAAILLRAKGIPAVVGAGASILDVPDGTTIALDGGTGELVVDPPDQVRQAYLRRAAELVGRDRAARAAAHTPSVTRDGVEILVGANLGSVADARAAGADGADLAGLVRTEFLFLDRAAAPDVDEQESIYREIAAALGGRRVTLRTLDVGGDKPLSYLPAPAEDNPFLGVRGIRWSLANPGLLDEQLLAAVRVAHETPISLMFPMVSTLDELSAARRALDGAVARAGRGEPAGLRVGIMVEVPAAALKASVFARHVDFMSIGTNDLTQYALAADRGNDAVAAVGDPFDPGLLRLVEATCRGAAGRALVAVCGEFAADPRASGVLLGLGVRELSVTPRAVPATKQAVRAVDLTEAATLAAAALRADSAADVRALLAGPAEPPR